MKFTAPTISFLGLVALAAVLGAGAYFLSTEVDTPLAVLQNNTPQNKAPTGPVLQQYTDDNHLISFLYPPGWDVKTYNRDDYDVIVLASQDAGDHMRIYVSSSGYFGLGGLKTTPVTIGDVKGVTVNYTIFGVKNGANYYTFDPGTDQTIMPQFDTILTTIAFSK